MSDELERRARLRSKLKEEAAIAALKWKLFNQYDDLCESTDRGDNVRLCSKHVNSITNRTVIYHTCGCCPDAGLIVRPYIRFYDGDYYVNVFSDPPSFDIGQQVEFGEGDEPYEGWEQRLKDHDIPDKVIEEVKAYFKENPPRNYVLEEVEDEP